MALAENTELELAQPATPEAPGQAVAHPAPEAQPSNIDQWIFQAIQSRDPTIVREVREFVDQIRRERERAAFNHAFAAAMAEMPTIPKTKEAKRVNANTGKNAETFKYAPIEVIMAHVQPVLNRHGMYLNFIPRSEGDQVTVVGTLGHSAGHAITATESGRKGNLAANTDEQNKKATRTSLMRTIAECLLGLAISEEEEATVFQGQPPSEYDIERVLHTIDNMESKSVVEAIAAELKAWHGDLIGEPPEWARPQLTGAWRRRVDQMAEQMQADNG